MNPTFDYSLTERLRAGVGLNYEDVRYDAESGQSTRTDDVLQSWTVARLDPDPQSEVALAVYASQYQAKDDSSETDAYGAGVGYTYQWSEVTGVEARLDHENNDVTDYAPVKFEESTSGLGGSLVAYRKLEVSDWRFTLSRQYLPPATAASPSRTSSGCSTSVTSVSDCPSWAARYEMRNAITESGGGDDRDYARLDLSLNLVHVGDMVPAGRIQLYLAGSRTRQW